LFLPLAFWRKLEVGNQGSPVCFDGNVILVPNSQLFFDLAIVAATPALEN
jgi:1-acyl-sn-glycerol-3-phosphate acyltransferase